MDLLHRVATDHAAAILVVTHDEKIFGHFDRLIRLRDGHVEAEEPMLAVQRTVQPGSDP
jgi:putative ABC transport system ATP-binding protein